VRKEKKRMMEVKRSTEWAVVELVRALRLAADLITNGPDPMRHITPAAAEEAWRKAFRATPMEYLKGEGMPEGLVKEREKKALAEVEEVTEERYEELLTPPMPRRPRGGSTPRASRDVFERILNARVGSVEELEEAPEELEVEPPRPSPPRPSPPRPSPPRPSPPDPPCILGAGDVQFVEDGTRWVMPPQPATTGGFINVRRYPTQQDGLSPNVFNYTGSSTSTGGALPNDSGWEYRTEVGWVRTGPAPAMPPTDNEGGEEV
jgi:hypothetical protein